MIEFPWNKPLPQGDALEREALRLGVSLQEALKGGAQGHTFQDGVQLQHRVLAARNARSTAIVNLVQSIGIIGTLIITCSVAIWGRLDARAQRNGESAQFMLQFDHLLDSDRSGLVAAELDQNENLDKFALKGDASDEAIDDFLSNYELLDSAYRNHLISDDMAYDAFSWELEKALNDRTVRRYVSGSRAEEGDLFDGVFELAAAWKLKYPPINLSK